MGPFFKMALDPGFGCFKAAMVAEGELYSVILPSLVGVGETSLGLLQTGITRQKKSLPQQIRFEDGQTFLTGSNVGLYARPSQRLDTERLGDSPEQRALTLTTLGLLIQQVFGYEEFDIDLGLIAALPVHVLQGADARSVVQALETWLVGDHHFELNDRPMHLHIHGVKALAQPLGSFFEWGLNTEGQWNRAPADLKASVAVLDQGFNTLDLFHLSGGQIVRRFTNGETLGMRRAAKIMQDLVLHKLDRKLSMHEADDLIRQSCNGHKVEMVIRGEGVDLKPLARQALDVAAGEVKAYLSQTWEDGKVFDTILLTGGGILALGERIRSVYGNAVEMVDPVTANARGLARFAQRAGVFELPKQVA
ncbi:MAG TPA: ParM/StbA family protein [Anaerolineaceae bacterium]|nr:ParM/StbA family protein [Anaerolineaceae bacterium]